MTTETLIAAARDADLLSTTPTRYVYPDGMNASPDKPRAVIYVRQSKARDDGSTASPQMQRTAGEAHCVGQGFTPVACFSDVGKSGWDPKVVRPAFEEMMTWVREKKCDVVVIYTLSRLTRQGAIEALAIEKLMRDNGVALVSVREPFLDTSTPIGIGFFAIMAGLAQQESDLKSEYIKDTRTEAREIGGHVSGPAPFGTVAVKALHPSGVGYLKLEADPFEKAIVRRMYQYLLDGYSAGQIAAALNRDEVPTPAQRKVHAGRKGHGFSKPTKIRPEGQRPVWAATQVFRVMRDPRIAGMAADRAANANDYVIRRDEAGNPLHVHEAILTPGEWFEAQRLMSPDGKREKIRSGIQHLLSGWAFLFCPCGSKATCSGSTGKAVRTYRCSRNSEYRAAYGHTGLSVVADAADDYVANRVFSRMLALDVEDENDAELLGEVTRRFAAASDTSGAGRELAAVRAQLAHTTKSVEVLYEDKDVHKLYEGKIGRAAFARALGALTTVEEECTTLARDLEASLTKAAVLPVDEWCGTDPDSGVTDPTGPGSPWSTWDVIRRREFLALWIDRVEMVPSTAWRGPVRDRLVITWARPAEDDQEDA